MNYGNIELSVEVVTPAIAALWLDSNDVNRRLRSKVVDMYASDMSKGAWEWKPIAICFDTENKLGNGQHTLNAIVKAGIEQTMLIARNCRREQIAAMDIGVRRSVEDIGHFLNIDVNRRELSTARAIKYGINDNNTRSFSDLYDAFVEHEEAINFVMERAVSKTIGMNASVLSVVAVAWYAHDRDDLSRFLRLLSSGIAEEPRDKTIIRLRDFCHSLRGGANSRPIRLELHKKTASALDSYLSGKTKSKLYGSSTNKFKLSAAKHASL
jgi:hypothetical protein